MPSPRAATRPGRGDCGARDCLVDPTPSGCTASGSRRSTARRSASRASWLLTAHRSCSSINPVLGPPGRALRSPAGGRGPGRCRSGTPVLRPVGGSPPTVPPAARAAESQGRRQGLKRRIDSGSVVHEFALDLLERITDVAPAAAEARPGPSTRSPSGNAPRCATWRALCRTLRSQPSSTYRSAPSRPTNEPSTANWAPTAGATPSTGPGSSTNCDRAVTTPRTFIWAGRRRILPCLPNRM
jgi:hypothetical protein